MSQDEPPLCDTCNVILTLNHIITECKNTNITTMNSKSPNKFDKFVIGPNPQDIKNMILYLKKNYKLHKCIDNINGQVVNVFKDQ